MQPLLAALMTGAPEDVVIYFRANAEIDE